MVDCSRDAGYDASDNHDDFHFCSYRTKHRTKIIFTCCLWFAFALSGWTYKQMGPVLLDLQQLTGVSYTIASTYMVAMNIGYIVGCLVCGLLYGKISTTIILCFTFLGSTLSSIMLPWSTNALETYVIHFFIGVSIGNIDASVIAELAAMWSSKVAVPMQVAFFCYSSGGALAIVITAPFLKTTVENPLHPNIDNDTSLLDNVNVTDKNHTFKSKIAIPFAITASLDAIAAIVYIVLYIQQSKTFKVEYIDIKIRSSSEKNMLYKIIGLAIFSVLMALSSSFTFNLSYFLPSILVKLSVSSRSISAYITSVFATSQAIGRLTGFFSVRFIDNFSLLLGYSVICIVGLVGFWNSIVYQIPIYLLCLSVTITGLGFSIMDASLKSWVEESFLPVTGPISSLFFIVTVIGDILASVCIGYLVDVFSSFMFLYITLGEVLIFFVLVFAVNAFLELFININENK